MKNILIINTHIPYKGANEGKLTTTIVNKMEDILKSKEYNVEHTNILDGYDISTEIEKFYKTDIVIFQIPLYWMGVPGESKVYMDQLFSASYGKMFKSDGRKSDNPDINYGTGGLMQGKTYMLSITTNAPLNAFTDPNEFFGGRSVDELFYWLHLNFKFLGYDKGLDTFMMNDVIKNVDFQKGMKSLEDHMNRVF